MKTLLLKFLTLLLYPYLRYYKNIVLKGNNTFAFSLFKKFTLSGSKRYPIIIKNSVIGRVVADEGCKILDSICIGDVTLGRFVTLAGPGVKIVGNVRGVKIGSFTSVGANVIIQEGEHDYTKATTYFINKNIICDDYSDEISRGEIIIEEDVWIGSNSVILSGVTIGRGSIIGAGSVITRSIPRYSICVGNPGKVIKQRFDSNSINLIEDSKWWTWSTDTIVSNKTFFTKKYK